MDLSVQEIGFTYDEAMRIGRLGGRIIPSVTDIVGQIDDGVRGDMEKGIAVHKGVELINQDRLNWKKVDDSILGFLMGYETFLKETEFKPLRIEERLVNRTLRFHGRLDIEGTWKLGCGRVLIDVKKYAPGDVTGLQLSGYDLLLPQVKRHRVGLELKEDGGYQLHWFEDIEDRNVFLALLATMNWKLNHGIKK